MALLLAGVHMATAILLEAPFFKAAKAAEALFIVAAVIKTLYFVVEGRKQQTPIGAIISLALLAFGVWYVGDQRGYWVLDYEARSTLVLGTLLACVLAAKLFSLLINVVIGMDFGAASGGRR